MNKILLPIATLILTIAPATAKDEPSSQLPEGAVTQPMVEQSTSSVLFPKTVHPDGAVTDASIEHSASTIIVTMNIHTDAFDNKANREVWLTPVIAHGDSSLALPPVVVAGRTRYYQRLRADGDNPGYTLLRAGAAETYAYSVNLPRKDWMESGQMVMLSRLDGCCGYALAAPSETALAEFDFRDRTLSPVYLYVKPLGEIEKSRMVSGSAYIDFPVSVTQIMPDYRRNPQELAKISQTIEEAKGNKDITITSLTIKGFASPDGPYATNEQLAKGRTESLIRYVADRFVFPASVLHSEWVAEDWEGFAESLRKSDLADKEAILALITNTAYEPDAREYKLRIEFPEQYPYILNEIYPTLRRSDYDIAYIVRNYTDVAEIAEVMRTAPQHLSLEELFIYAKSLDESSPEFREVMEVAVRMFPSDPIANLNAASTAIDHGEYAKAREYLVKADRSPAATYTAGVLEAMEGNYAIARPLLEQALQQGVTEAASLLDALSKL